MVRRNIMAPNVHCVSGTHAYIITRNGARSMLEIGIPIKFNIDKQMRDHFGTRLKFYCTSPEISEQNWELRNDRVGTDVPPQK